MSAMPGQAQQHTAQQSATNAKTRAGSLTIVRPALALLALAAAAILPSAAAHGYLQKPMARNWLHAGQRKNSGDVFWSPMSLNHAGKQVRSACCGGEYNSDPRFSVGGKWARRSIVASYKSGQTISTRIQITNNHWGYLQLRLCPLSSTSDATEKAQLSDACFKKYTLKQTNGSSKYWIYHGKPGEAFAVESSWRLPAGIRCPRCVLQWRYMTGHKCYLPGVDKKRMLQLAPGGAADCKNGVPPEIFWNCADIKIT